MYELFSQKLLISMGQRSKSQRNITYQHTKTLQLRRGWGQTWWKLSKSRVQHVIHVQGH